MLSEAAIGILILILLILVVSVVGVRYVSGYARGHRSKPLLEVIGVIASLAIGTAGLLITVGLEAQKQQAARWEEGRKQAEAKLQIAPKLVFESVPARYDLDGRELVLDVTNYGYGSAYRLAVGLEHESSEDTAGWSEPLRWQKVYLVEDTSFRSIKPESTYTIRVDLLSAFAGPLEDREKVDSLLNLGLFEDFKVYVAYQDIEGDQYLVTSIVLPSWMEVIRVHEKDFWDRLDELLHPAREFLPRYYRDVDILPSEQW